MPRRSTSPERKPSASDDEEKPKIKNEKAKRGRLDGAARAALASTVIQRGVAATLADIDTVSAEVSWCVLDLADRQTGLSAQQVKNQLTSGRKNLRMILEAAANDA